MNLRLLGFLLGITGFLYACSGTRSANSGPVYSVEMRNLDTLEVQADRPDRLRAATDITLPHHRATPQRKADILHTRLDLQFDWANETVIGTARLMFTPFFYPIDTLVLDAKSLDVEAVTLEPDISADFVHRSDLLFIPLPQKTTRADTLTVTINYRARPAASGGSAAITSNQGLFFINPRGKEAGKPRQIWTQGETEWNSRWFPTIDEPNERFTQTISLRVDTNFATLSNGVKTRVEQHDDGTRTDTWTLDRPHAPYLSMIAVGEWAVVEDEWEGIPLGYYVEPAYADDARAIFAHTGDMLAFFSDTLDMSYPWPVYNQVVVRDYVSGAMENTTAVVFGDFVQKHRRELIDQSNDGIVAHELMHHWFGNLVTCESWAHLTLNEGFASYAEYLWLEHWEGREAADHHLRTERRIYMSGFDFHPLIHYQYEDAEDMFDAHSYNKGAAVLHMLRYELGDAAFFAGLKKYLRQHAGQAVEESDLRLALEAASGRDLRLFFDQWFLSSGHPMVQVKHDWNPVSQSVTLSLEQVQNPDRMPAVFRLPVTVEIWVNGKARRRTIVMDRRRQSFSLTDIPNAPQLILIDPDRHILAEWSYQRPIEAYADQYRLATNVMNRLDALNYLIEYEVSLTDAVLREALDDSFWAIRARAAEVVSWQDHHEQLRDLALNDPHSSVRAEALLRLTEGEADNLVPLATRILERDSAYRVMGAALEVLSDQDPDRAITVAKSLESESTSDLLLSLAHIYARSEDPTHLTFFAKAANRVDQELAFYFFDYYQELARLAEPAEAARVRQRLYAIASDHGEPLYRRFATAYALNEWKNTDQVDANLAESETEQRRLQESADQLRVLLKQLVQSEQDERLRTYYRQFPDVLPAGKQ